MPLARINSRIVHFVHIPKTGGACVTSYLRAKGRVALYSYDELCWSRTTPQHVEHRVGKVLVPEGFADVAFAIVRDPVDRMVSEFRYRAMRQARRAPVGSRAPGGPQEVEVGRGESFRGSFDDWVAFIFDRYARDPYVSDNHIRPQAEFLSDAVEVFSFHDGIEPVLRWIDRVTGTPPVPAELDRNESGGLPVRMAERTRDAIRDFYQADYRLLASRGAAPAPPRRRHPDER